MISRNGSPSPSSSSSSPSNTSPNYEYIIEALQDRIAQLESKMDSDSDPDVTQKQPVRTLHPYDDLIDHIPNIVGNNFYNSTIPEDEKIYELSDFYVNDTMSYNAPPLSRVSSLLNLPKGTQIMDKELSTIQGMLAQITHLSTPLRMNWSNMVSQTKIGVTKQWEPYTQFASCWNEQQLKLLGSDNNLLLDPKVILLKPKQQQNPLFQWICFLKQRNLLILLKNLRDPTKTNLHGNVVTTPMKKRTMTDEVDQGITSGESQIHDITSHRHVAIIQDRQVQAGAIPIIIGATLDTREKDKEGRRTTSGRSTSPLPTKLGNA